MQKELVLPSVCNFITKYAIYVLIFLMPLFFLPFTNDVLDFNKQYLLLALVAIAVFAQMVKILALGEFEFKKNILHIIVGALLLVYTFSTIFSVYGATSFWGQTQQTATNSLIFICLAVFYVISGNILLKKDFSIATNLLFISVVVAQIFGILQLLGKYILPFDFASIGAFTTVGYTSSLAVISIILLPMAIVLLVNSKKWWKLLFAVQILLCGYLLVLLNYAMLWWAVVAGVGAVLVLSLSKKNFIDSRWMIVPMFLLVASLFFAVMKPQINLISPNNIENFFPQKMSYDIAIQALKERPILGSGPGTFGYDFSKFKSPEFSKSSIWSVVFNKPSSKAFDVLTTTGILGIIAFLTLIAFAIYKGLKLFLTNSNDKIFILGLTASLFVTGVLFFLYNSNVTIDFVWFFLLSGLVIFASENKKKYSLKSSQLLALSTTFACAIIFIFGAGLLIFAGQRYAGEVNYYNGIQAYLKKDTSNFVKYLENALRLNSKSDVYLKQLSQAYLLGLQEEVKNAKSTATDEQKMKVQTYLTNTVNAAKFATDANSNDATNWSFRGFVYQSLAGVLDNAPSWAITSYDSALKLDPNNPYLYLQEGSVYLVDKNFTKAKEKLEKSIALKPDYSDAWYYLGLTYNSLGQKDKAIEAFTILQQLNPDNKDIAKILNNLKNGLSALNTPAPIQEAPPQK